MIDKDGLRRFLVKAKKSTYAAGSAASKIVEADRSTSLIFEEGSWRYHDNYFGGEPFGGREVVFLQNKPIYLMVYYGQVIETASDFEDVYRVLQRALSLIPEDRPFRGPESYKEGDFSYTNTSTGDIDSFFGTETISRAGREIYTARYVGGFIDQRK